MSNFEICKEKNLTSQHIGSGCVGEPEHDVEQLAEQEGDGMKMMMMMIADGKLVGLTIHCFELPHLPYCP